MPQPLARTVGLWGAVWMGLGSILGTGVFVSLGIAAGVVGTGVVWAVALAALVAIANGLSSAQLAAAHPVSGGTYAYGRKFVHPAAGFVAGWMYLSAKSASAATAALGCAGYLLHTLGWGGGMAPRVGLALALVLGTTALVAGGVRRSNAVNIAIVSVTLLALGAFVAGGLWTTGPAALLATVGPDVLTDALASPAALAHATALMFVAYTGYGRIATLGEEVSDPARTIPRAIIATLAVSMVLYISVAATAVAVVGAETFARSTGDLAAPLEVVARQLAVPGVAWLVAIGAMTAMAGVLLNLVLGLSRVLFAMARAHDMPHALAAVNAAHSPSRAVWAMGAVIAALVCLGDVRTTWSFSAVTVLTYYGLTNLAALRLPPEARRFPRWIAWAGLLACFGLSAFVSGPAWLAGAAMLAVGFGVRALVRR
ncbi:MAG: APA family basic amino acid/polyamine antiporter [Myxococcota bacterium]|jgi:APA family basic amino acid/polyamine antiporter